jgi:peptide deformylase
MARLTILEFPDPRLRKKADAVGEVDDSVRALVDDLTETLRASGGIGLAATQVDVHRRVVVIDLSGGQQPAICLINPELLSTSVAGMSEESCLSVPGVVDVVRRDLRARVRAQGRDGVTFEHEFEGLAAACVQHELEHLEGKLFIDRLSCLKRARYRRKLERQLHRAP